MKSKQILLVSMLAFGLLAGCNKSDGGPAIGKGGRISDLIANNNPNDPANCNGHTCGTITGPNQDSFQQAWYAFLETDSTEFGFISAQPSQSTGARFYMTASTTSPVDCSGAGNNAISINPYQTSFTLLLFDSLASSAQYPPIALPYNGAVDGQIQGNSVIIHFEDEFGDIYFDGTISGGMVSGVFNFDDGSGAFNYDGALVFKIPARAIFACR